MSLYAIIYLLVPVHDYSQDRHTASNHSCKSNMSQNLSTKSSGMRKHKSKEFDFDNKGLHLTQKRRISRSGKKISNIQHDSTNEAYYGIDSVDSKQYEIKQDDNLSTYNLSTGDIKHSDRYAI